VSSPCKDRRKAIEYFGIEGGPDFDKDPIGRKITLSNAALINGFQKLGLRGNVRTISQLFI
jgi:hypothetical protein